MANSTYVAIMAGGIGSRFWPASRVEKPKQFHDILGVGKSLLRLTFERFAELVPAEHIFVITNEIYRDLVNAHLPELSDEQILGEPSRNNTAPSVAWMAFRLKAMDPNANFVIAPSDHVILKEKEFLVNIRRALDFTAENEALCTLGIQPTRPDTGYGYIHYDKKEVAEGGIHKVLKFVEKPDLATARSYLESGNYLWNAGIFIWRAETILTEFSKQALGVYEVLAKGEGLYGTQAEKQFISENYPKTQNISVDFAILEKAGNVYTIPSDIGWSDLGTWSSLYEESEKTEAGNVVQGKNVIALDVQNCLVRVSDNKLAVIKGLENFIVVDEGDVLLIWPKWNEQEIKAITHKIKGDFGETFL